MNINFIEYNGISGYAKVMYNDVKDSDKYEIAVQYNGKDIKALLEYLFKLENTLDKIKEYIKEALNINEFIGLNTKDVKYILELLKEIE